MEWLQRIGLSVFIFLSGIFGSTGAHFTYQSKLPTPATTATPPSSNAGEQSPTEASPDLSQAGWVPASGGFADVNGISTTLPPAIAGLLQSTADSALTKTATTVYAFGAAMPGADASSFFAYPVGPALYARDKNQIYCIFGRGQVSTIPNVSLGSFTPVLNSQGQESGFATDSLHVYSACDVFPDADPATFVALTTDNSGDGYIKDKSHVWYLCPEDGSDSSCSSFGTQLVPGADPATFELYSSDAPISATTPIVDATDKNHSYNSGQVVQ